MPRKRKPSLVDLHTELQKEDTLEKAPLNGEMVSISKSELSNEERLEQLEQIIDTNLKAFYAAGSALKEIRDHKLYKLQGFVNFEEYCVQRWEMHRANAYRLIDSSTVITNLSPIKGQFLPANERQVRPLTKLSPEQQQEVWKKVIESAPTIDEKPQVTAKLVEEIVSEITGGVIPEEKPKNDKAIYKVSMEIDDMLNEAFYRIRQLAGKKRKKVSKGVITEILLQVILEELKEQKDKSPAITRILDRIEN